MKRKALLLAFIALTLTLAFQNCGDVNLTPATGQITEPSVTTKAHRVSVQVCLPQTNFSWDIYGYPLIVNLNAIAKSTGYLPDSDADGLPDNLEKPPFSEANRTSLGINDLICWQSLTNPPSAPCDKTCTPTQYVQLGVTDCDVQAYSSPSGSLGVFDSDKDGVPDFIELIRSSDLMNSNESNLDDGDGRLTFAEIRDQTDPNFDDSGRNVQKYRATKNLIVPNPPDCPTPAKAYLLQVADLPFVPTEVFNDPLPSFKPKLSLSHGRNQNVIGIFFIAYSNTAASAYRGYVATQIMEDTQFVPGTILQSFDLKMNTDMTYIGEWN